MFCGNCGTQNPDDAPFCAGCGAQLNAQPAPAPVEPGFAPPAPAPKKSKKGLIAIGVAALAVIVALVLIFTFTGRGAASPKALAKKYIQAIQKGDGEAMLKLYHKKMVEEQVGDKDDQKEYAEYLEETAAYLKDCDFEILEVEDVDEDQMEEIKEYAEEEYGIKVKDAKVIVIAYSGEINGYEVENELELHVIKVGNKWYAAN